MKNIWKNTFAHISFGLTSQVMLFLFTMYVARVIGPLEYGKFSFSLTYALFFLILIEFGTNVYAAREVGAHPDTISPFFLVPVKIFFAIFGYAILFLSLYIPQVCQFRPYITVLGLGMVGASFLQYSVAVFQGFGLLRYGSFLLFFQKVLYISTGLLLLSFSKGALSLSISYTIGMIISAILGLFWLSKRSSLKDLVYRVSIRELIKFLPFVFVRFFSEIYFRIDILMIQLFIGTKMVGLYSLPYKIIEALLLFVNSFVFSLFPKLSYSAEADIREFARALDSAMKLIAVWGALILVLGFLLGRRFFLIFFGIHYVESIGPFYVLLIALFFMQLNSLLTHALLSLKKERFYATIIFATSILNFLLNLWFIPHYKIMGAGITTLVSELFLFGFTYIGVYKWTKSENG